MKRKFTALIAIAAIVLTCVPVFSGCSGKQVYTLKEDEQGKYYSVSYSGYSPSLKGRLEIPAEHDGIPVKEIEQEGFAGGNLTSVVIPATVTKIGDAAFAHNYQLEEASFADGSAITEIARGMFGFCQSLRSIAIPETVNEIGIAAFLQCERLSAINLPQGLEKINDQAFEGCYEITQAEFPQTLSYIGERAYYSTGLKKVVIPDSVRDEITTDSEGKEKTVRALGYGAFHTCLSLEEATVGSGVTELPAGTFASCTALKKVTLSSSLKKVEGAVFKNNNLYCGHAFFGCSALEDIYFNGSKEQWAALKENIDNKPYKYNNVTYDNSPVLRAVVHYVQ